MLFVLIILTIMNLVNCMTYMHVITVHNKDLFCLAGMETVMCGGYQVGKSIFLNRLPVIKTPSLFYLLLKKFKFLFIRWDAVVVGQENLMDVKVTEDVARVAVIA
jgi:hypothetical protein